MSEFLKNSFQDIAQAVANSAPHDWAIYLLRNVPGFPPIVQTVHIVSVAVVVASIIFVHLRILGWAVPQQQLSEMQGRLLPWFWWSLPILFFSGLIFILARPRRYFLNPVFGIKVLSICVVIFITVFLLKQLKNQSNEYSSTTVVKCMAFVSILLWITIMLAGRWIAYADYLFPPPM